MGDVAARGTVLILEDDPGIQRLQRGALERAGYTVALASEIREAEQRLASGGIDLLLLDYQLGAGENGLEFYRKIHSEGNDLPAILVTGFGDETRLLEAMRAGVRDFIPKTANFVELVAPTVERVMREVQRERRLHEAEAANRAKDDFLAALSHELRTPLTPVLALVSVLRHDERLPTEVRADIALIHRNIGLEARLIDDLLDLTRVVRGKLELRLETLELESIINHALSTVCDPEVNVGGVKCHGELLGGAHGVRADGARLTQVFWNLLKNASKFTSEGGNVWIRSRMEVRDGQEWICVEIADDGIGIEPAALPRIFGAFEQGGRGITRQFGGLGLGLAISKAIIELHGGSISAASQGRGLGATFTVCLPLAPEGVPATSPEPGSANGVASRGLHAHVLLVEDHTDTAQILGRMLRRAGFTVTEAASVASATDVVERAHEGSVGDAGPIDLVVSDIGLPDGTGIDLMAKLRDRYKLPGIALSGFGMEEDIRRAEEAGFARHLTKPVDVDDLLHAIHQLLQTTRRDS